MLCRCQLTLKIDPKKPTAFADFFALMQRCCVVTPATTLEFDLAVGRRSGLLVELAHALPPAAEGFRIGTEKVTAGTILERAGRKGAAGLGRAVHFHGDLLQYLSFDAALLLVRDLTALDAAVPGAFGHLSARDIAIAGAASGVTVSITIRGLGQYPKKAAVVYCTCDLAVETDDRAVPKRVLAELEQASGLPWRRAVLHFVPTVTEAGVEDQDHWIATYRSLTPAIGSIAGRLRGEGLRWRDLPRLRTRHSGFRHRLQEVTEGIGTGPVDWKGGVRALIKQAFPSFAARGGGFSFEFVQTLRADAELVLAFESIHHAGPGKTYTAYLGFRRKAPPAAGLLFVQPLSRFLEYDDDLVWTYATAADLDACLQETGRLLTLILPLWRQACLDLLNSDGSDRSWQQPVRGALTLHEACVAAAAALGALDPHSDLVLRGRMTTGVASVLPYMPKRTTSPEAEEGRLGPDESWDILFGNRHTGRTVMVTVPHSGPLRYGRRFGVWIGGTATPGELRIEEPVEPDDFLMLPPSPQFPPEPAVARTAAQLSGLADSPRLLAFAEAQVGRDFRHTYPGAGRHFVFNVRLTATGDLRPYWYVAFVALAPARIETAMHISAAEPFSSELLPPRT
jgi:hypothetical protein